MFQKGVDIVRKSRIVSDVLIVNQCDNDSTVKIVSSGKNIRMISTTSRGLSVSRNIAIDNAVGDICLICDDDEVFEDNYEENIIKAFAAYPEAEILAFIVTTPPNAYNHKTYKLYPYKLTYLNALKVTSYQIAFKLKAIKKNNIRFDETIGSGISAAGGEEKIFLHDCLKAGLKGYFVPVHIGLAAQDSSQWAGNLFSSSYFIDRGKFTKKLFGGKLFAVIYAFLFVFKKYPKYKNKISPYKALTLMLEGIFNR